MQCNISTDVANNEGATVVGLALKYNRNDLVRILGR
jgi:hypothetical protein